MRVPNFVTVLGVRLCMTAEGLFTLYQIPAAVFSAKGASLKEKFGTAFQAAAHPKARTALFARLSTQFAGDFEAPHQILSKYRDCPRDPV